MRYRCFFPLRKIPISCYMSLRTGVRVCHLRLPVSYTLALARSVRLSVPWRSCLGYRHAGCLQLSHRRPPGMCGLRTRPRTDVDPPRFLPPSNRHRRGAYRLAAHGAIPLCYRLFSLLFDTFLQCVTLFLCARVSM